MNTGKTFTVYTRADGQIRVYADDTECAANEMTMAVEGDHSFATVPVKMLSEGVYAQLLDALMALMEGELAAEATIRWSDAAAQKYAGLEMQGVC